MAGEAADIRRTASHWHVRLREEPDDDATQAAFADWLGADPRHGQAWRHLCSTMAVVDRAPDAWRALPQPCHPPRLHRRRTSKRRGRGIGMAAGAIAAACGIVLALPAIMLRIEADYRTGSGRVERFRLADGSAVRLGPDSAIAVDYGGRQRTVRLLSGQAMFDVRRDPSRPFRVEAGPVTTFVLGTRFDVRRLGDVTGVAVMRGRVRVDAGNASSFATRDLRAGEWVRIAGTGGAEAGRVAPQLVGAWQTGEALAENRTIGSIVDEIRPWFGGRIHVSDADLAARRVSGIYDVRNPEQALRMIVRPHGGRITRITPWLLIVSGD